jgi:hypothetical protein
MKRYDYKLTPDGQRISARLRETAEYEKIREIVTKMLQAGNPSYMELSIAAKAFFILRNKKETLSKQEIIREAQKFDWNIQPASLATAVSFLDRLGVLQH